MSVAILSKQTFLVLLPVLLYVLWCNGDARNRRFTFAAFRRVVFIMLSATYVLYAALKTSFPTVAEAIENGKVVAEFGQDQYKEYQFTK